MLHCTDLVLRGIYIHRWMSYTAANVSLLPNASLATLQLGGNLSLLRASYTASGGRLPGLLNLQESQWGSRGPPSRSTAAHVIYEETKQGWALTPDWEIAVADAVTTLRPLAQDGSIAGCGLDTPLTRSSTSDDLPLPTTSPPLALTQQDNTPHARHGTARCFCITA